MGKSFLNGHKPGQLFIVFEVCGSEETELVAEISRHYEESGIMVPKLKEFKPWWMSWIVNRINPVSS